MSFHAPIIRAAAVNHNHLPSERPAFVIGCPGCKPAIDAMVAAEGDSRRRHRRAQFATYLKARLRAKVDYELWERTLVGRCGFRFIDGAPHCDRWWPLVFIIEAAARRAIPDAAMTIAIDIEPNGIAWDRRPC